MIIALTDINSFFRRVAETVLKFRLLFLILLLSVCILSFYGIRKVELNSSWESWFFEDDPIVVAKKRFEKVFGNSDSGALLIQADDIFTHDVLKMIRELGREIEDEVPFVDKVVSLTEFEFSKGEENTMIIGNLVPDLIPESKEKLDTIRKEAFSKENLVNKLFSDDSKETWIQIRLKEITDEFKNKPENKGVEPLYIIGKKINEIVSREKYREFNIKESGMPAVAYHKTEFFKKESGKVVMWAILASVVFLIIFLRSAAGVIIPVVTTFCAILISYGMMGLFGIKIDTMVMTVPVYLSMAVSIGYSIHILNFFKRSFLKSGKRKESVLHAVEQTGWPLFFTALTTIGCMLSFNFADITSIRWVGNASASMVTVVYVFVMVLNPVFLSFGKDKKEGLKEKEEVFRTDSLFKKMADFVLENPIKILGLSLVVTIILLVGIKDIKTDFDPFKSIGLRVPYIKNLYDVTNSKIGTMYSYNLTVEFQEAGRIKDPLVLKNFEKLEKEIKKLPLTKNSVSVLDVIKDMNRTLHGNSESYYRIPDSREMISQLLALYENSGGQDSEYWMDNYDYKILRLQVGISKFEASEVERELALIGKITKEIFPDAKSGMVGSFVEGAVVNNYIARGQMKMSIVALFVICFLMIVVFESFKAGLIGLIPNLLPLVVIWGVMGYFDIHVDMMSMTIVPMLMGIAVDDSIHFINHIKLAIEGGEDYEGAVHKTYKTVGRALFTTSLILVLTFGMYLTSDVAIYKTLGILVGLGLAAALLADYFITPVLINLTKPFKIRAN